MYDILVVSIPYVPYNLPLAAPAQLVGHLKSKGFSATAKECNIKFKLLFDNSEKLEQLISYWTQQIDELDDDVFKKYHKVLDRLAKEICKVSTKWIALSVFTIDSRRFCKDILPYIREYRKEQSKILLGGLGLNDEYLQSVSGLYDCYIMGEGEYALEHLLKGNLKYPGINSQGVQIENLDDLGLPDYSDYDDLDKYDSFYHKPSIQVTGSRGCVRNCSFCNVAFHWPKFRWRSGELLAQDIISLYEKTGVEDFFFTDSLINGNIKELMKMMSLLADYKKQNNANITWGGQWIARKKGSLPKDYYKLIKESGGYNLTIGVESGSDSVREHMKKGFTNEDLDYEMEQFSIHGITCSFFMFTGYVTETHEDFLDTLRMFYRYTKYVADGTIVGVMMGGSLIIFKGTPLMEQLGESWTLDGINKAGVDSVLSWKSLTTDLTVITAVERRLIAQLVLKNLHWPDNNSVYELVKILTYLKTYSMESDKTFDLKNYDKLSNEFTIPDSPHDYNVQINLTGNPCRNIYPRVDVEVNNKIILNDVEIKGDKELKLLVEDKIHKNTLRIHLKNKDNGTVLNDSGEIIEDLSLHINNLIIGGVRVNSDDIYLKGEIVSVKGTESKGTGLYENGSYNFYFENPILSYFINNRHFFYSSQRDKNLQINKELEQYLVGLTK